jgi:phage-related protein
MSKDFKELTDEILPKLQKFWAKYGPDITKIIKELGEIGNKYFVGMLKSALYGLSAIVDILNGDWKKAFKDAWKSVENLLEAMIGGFGNLLNVIGNLGKSLGRALKPVWDGIKKGAEEAWDAIKTLIGWIGRIVGKAVSITANVFGLGAIKDLVNWIGRVASKTVSVGAKLLGGIPGFAHGGIIGAAGGGARSNLTMVGEQGPELVRLPYGSQVIPTPQVQSMMAGGGGGGGALTVHLEWIGGNGGDEFMTWLRRNIRIRAGAGANSVQQALGQTY